MRIQQTIIEYYNGKQTKAEVKEITENEYTLLTDKKTIKFFRSLGGSETIKTRQTYYGMKVIYLSSISPDKSIKIVREFKFK
jgi:hypothetical protein